MKKIWKFAQRVDLADFWKNFKILADFADLSATIEICQKKSVKKSVIFLLQNAVETSKMTKKTENLTWCKKYA